MSDERLKRAVALYDRFTHGGMDRRTFMAELTRIAGGAAAAGTLLAGIAAQAACAPIVPADEPGLAIATRTIAVRPDRPLGIYVAAPTGREESAPAVIVVHENRGLNDHIRDVARRFALAGYAAYAPDFLSSAGGTPQDEDRAREMIGELDLSAATADGVALARLLGAGRRRVGVVGFCWGGAMVHRLVLGAGDRLAAGVSFYGPAPDPAEAARLEVSLLIILAERDERVNRTALPYARAAEAAGKPVRTIMFPGVDHAFHNDTSAARYDAAAAASAWSATLEFFGRHLRA